jgi:hypothetical protein
MGFKPGQSGNPAGRPAGRGIGRKPGGDLLVFRAKQSGNALAFFRDVMDSEVVPLQLRLVAAQGLAPYEHARCTDRRISCPIELPVATDIATARGNIGIIKAYMAAGRLGLEEGAALIEAEMKTIDAHRCSLVFTAKFNCALRCTYGTNISIHISGFSCDNSNAFSNEVFIGTWTRGSSRSYCLLIMNQHCDRHCRERERLQDCFHREVSLVRAASTPCGRAVIGGSAS